MAKSYGHRVHKIAPGHYRLSWTVDYHRPKKPCEYIRDTGRTGAMRFAKRWNVTIRGDHGRP